MVFYAKDENGRQKMFTDNNDTLIILQNARRQFNDMLAWDDKMEVKILDEIIGLYLLMEFDGKHTHYRKIGPRYRSNEFFSRTMPKKFQRFLRA